MKKYHLKPKPVIILLFLIGSISLIVGVNNHATGDVKMENSLTLEEFWNLYFNGKFVFLKRESDEYVGEYGDYSQANKNAFVQFPKFVKFKLSKTDLARYQYEKDERFAQMNLEASIRHSLDDRNIDDHDLKVILDVLLNGEKTPKEILQSSAPKKMEYLKLNFPSSEQLLVLIIEYLTKSTVTKKEWLLYKENGNLEYLNTEKLFFLRAASAASCEFVRPFLQAFSVSPYEARAVACESIVLLSRFNIKEDIAFFKQILSDSELESRHFYAGKALKFICSGKETIEKPLEEEFLSFWTKKLKTLPGDWTQWLQWDAESVYWEKRLNTIHFCMENEIDLPLRTIKELQNDEVKPVRQAAMELNR